MSPFVFYFVFQNNKLNSTNPWQLNCGFNNVIIIIIIIILHGRYSL